MAIKISGTTVINDSKDINNVGIITANIIHLTGGSFTIDDTRADTAIVVNENFHIYNKEDGSGLLRSLIEKDSNNITIGQADTGTIDKISLIPGKGSDGTYTELWAGNASASVGILTANAAGVTVSGISSVGAAITMYGATGIVSATSFYGSGANLTGLTGVSADTYGSATSAPVITVDANGRISTITTATISGGGGGGGISMGKAIAAAMVFG